MIKEIISIERIKELANRIFDNSSYLHEIIEEEKRSNNKMIEDLRILKLEAEQEADDLWKEYEYFADPSESIATQQVLHDRFLYYCHKDSILLKQIELVDRLQDLCVCIQTFKNEQSIRESYGKILEIVTGEELSQENKKFMRTLLTR